MQTKLITLIFTALIFSFQLSAQTLSINEHKLESSVKIYNEVVKTIDDLQANKNHKEEQMGPIESRINEGINILDEINPPDNEAMKKTVAYFRNNFIYQHAFMFGMFGKINRMNEYLLPLKDFFDQADASYFPCQYKFDGKNYKIEYSNFKYTRGEYYSSIAEGAYRTKQYGKALDYSKTGLGILDDGYLKTLLYYYCMESKAGLSQFDEEMAEQSLNYMSSFIDLNEEDKKLFTTNSYSYKAGWENLLDIFNKKPSPGNAANVFARAASIMVKAGDKALSEIAYQKSMDAGNNSKDFLFEVARSGEYSSKQIKTRACDELAGLSYLSCSDMDNLSQAYSGIGNSAQASAFSKKADKCRSKEQKSYARSSGDGFHVYLGTYPLRYMATKEYMDFGGVLGLSKGKFMLHASYMKVQQNIYAWNDMFFKQIDDNSNERYLWSGQQIDLAFRFGMQEFSKNSSAVYFGPQLGYSSRKLNPITSDVTDPVTGITVYGKEFEPLDTQYQLSLNMGDFVTSKVFAMDFNYSIGASYSQFSMDDPVYNLDYTYSHSYLNNRDEWHWGLVLRLGFTIGLNL